MLTLKELRANVVDIDEAQDKMAVVNIRLANISRRLLDSGDLYNSRRVLDMLKALASLEYEVEALDIKTTLEVQG